MYVLNLSTKPSLNEYIYVLENEFKKIDDFLIEICQSRADLQPGNEIKQNKCRVYISSAMTSSSTLQHVLKIQ